MTTSEILPLLSGVRRSGEGWIARCPSHDDSTPSLSVTEKNGRILLYCHAGCSYQEILSALGPVTAFQNFTAKENGLTLSRPKYPHSSSKKGPSIDANMKSITRTTLAAEYDYTDESGVSLYQVVRYELTYDDASTGKKFSARRRPNADERPSADGWVYNTRGIRLVLYNRTAIPTASLIYIVEGEKDVDTLTRLGVTATCNPFGAGKWRDEYNEPLRNKVVVILPDNDDPGQAHAKQIAHSLNGVAKEILIIDLPGLSEKGDLTEFIDNGGTADDLMDLVGRAEIWKPTGGEIGKSGTSKFVFTPLDELLKEPAESVSFIWDLTLPSGGFSICSAKPKVGKSTFARNLALAVANGGSFLGRGTKQGKVLYLCLEEKRSEIRKHFEKMNADSANILVYTGSTPRDAAAELSTAIVAFDPALVIIDPLSRVIRVPDFNDYGTMARGLEPLIDLARRSGTHIIALHHDSKMERSGGDALLGSTALFGAVDCHIQLKKRDAGRTILTTQRYGEDLPETVIELDKVTGLVHALGDLQLLAQENVKRSILHAMSASETLVEPEIKNRLEGHSRGVISKAIRLLVEEGLLTREGEGVRGNAYRYSKPD